MIVHLIAVFLLTYSANSLLGINYYPNLKNVLGVNVSITEKVIKHNTRQIKHCQNQQKIVRIKNIK